MAFPVIPEKWLNLKILAIADMVLAGILLIFQISMMGVYYGPYTNIGLGIWSGLILLATSFLVWKLSTTGLDGNMLGITIVLSGMSFLCGFLLLGFNATIIDVYRSCRSINLCSSVIGLAVILMLCGIVAILVNLLLGYALIKNYLASVNASPMNVTSSSSSPPP